MSDDEHAKYFSPSTADRWLTCGASIDANLEKTKGSAAANEGSVAHKLLDVCMKAQALPKRYIGKAVDPAFLSIKVTEDMIEAVDTAYTHLQLLAGKAVAFGTESRLDIKQTGEFGTTDFWALKQLKSGNFVLDVVDYKHGRGIAVFANDSKQMWLYALGAIQKIQDLKGKSFIGKLQFVRLTIIQPRCQEKPEAIDSVKITIAELLAFGLEVSGRASDYHAGRLKNQYAPSAKACQWCNKKSTCKARIEFATQGTVKKFEDFINPKAVPKVVSAKQIAEMTPQEMSTLYSRTKILQDVILSVAREAMKRLLSNRPETFPGYKLVEGKSSRKWSDTVIVAKQFAKLGLGLDDYMPRSLVGITVGEKLIPKEKRKSVMEQITMKPKGQPAIVLADDARKPFKPANAAKVFEEHLDDGE